MADKDLRSTYWRLTETSFGPRENDGCLDIRADQLPTSDEREEIQHSVQHQSSNSVDPIPALRAVKQPGLITRFGRGVKSAVGGAIEGAINIFVGNSSTYFK